MRLARAIAALLVKTFVADLWLSLTAVAAVAVTGLGVERHWLAPATAPFLLAGGVLAALAVGVARGSKP